jgi:hypothetical protein
MQVISIKAMHPCSEEVAERFESVLCWAQVKHRSVRSRQLAPVEGLWSITYHTVMDTLQQLNDDLMQTLRSQSLIDETMATIVADHDFWREVLSLHEFRVVADGTDMEQIVAPSYVNVFTESFFRSHFHAPEDVIRYSIHGGAHWKCVQLWKRCPVPYDTFTPTERAWIEDIYGQRFVKATAPSWHLKIPQTAEFYFEFHKIEMTPQRRDVINMLADTTEVANPAFAKIREWLYNSDPLDQQTFNKYMSVWSTFMQHKEFKQFLDTVFV